MHDHGIAIPVVIGPLVLRIILLGAVTAVTGFAMMRAFLPEPGRRTRVWITVLAPVAVLLELMLAAAFDLPSQSVVAVLAALAVPARVAVSGRAGPVPARLAPWVLSLACGAAVVEFARAWLGSATPGSTAILLHTALVLGLTGLAWVTLRLPRNRLMRVVVQVEAAVLAAAVLAGAGQATMLRPAAPLAAGSGGQYDGGHLPGGPPW